MRILLSLLLILACAGPSGGEPPKDEFADPDPVALVKRLRVRADAWWKARVKAVRPCNRCDGTGGFIYRGRGRVDCRWCRGGGKGYVREQWQQLLFYMRSPAWREQSNAMERATEEFAALDDRSGGAEVVSQYKIHRIQLIDFTHGVAWVLKGKDDNVARPYHWVWAKDSTSGSSDWWAYEERHDGTWPEAGEVNADSPEPLRPGDEEMVRAALAAESPSSRVQSLASVGETLVLAVLPAEDLAPAGMTQDRFRANAMQQIRATGAAALKALPRAKRLRWTLLAPWRDKFGVVQQRAWLTGSIKRSWFERIVWSNLDQEERESLFDLEWAAHEGWVLWWK